MSAPPLDAARVRARLAAAITAVGCPATEADLREAVSLTDDLGLDSMQLTEVARRLEVELGRDLDLGAWVLGQGAALLPDRTVGSLLRYVLARRVAR